MSYAVNTEGGAITEGQKPLISVLLVEDRPLSRVALRQLLSAHISMDSLADADNLDTAVEISMAHKPSLALVNYQLRKSNALSIAKAVQQQSPGTDILFVSMQESWIALATAIQSGVKGFVLESDPPGWIIEAVEALRAGYAYFSPPVALMFAKAYSNTSQSSHVTNLSLRELEILKHIGLGESNKEMAHNLNLSVKTVEAHRARLMKKLHVHSTIDLVRWAIQERLIRS
jgi:DNA-binding NarL/FixJ family response regulator